MNRLGFMQGRLSPVINGKIQCFPWSNWKDEFPIASEGGFYLMEWTLDQENLYENPLMTEKGRTLIKGLKEKYNIKIESLTGDCFMQSPFYKSEGPQREELLKDLINILKSCALVNIRYVVIPLVDNGRPENKKQEALLFEALLKLNEFLDANEMSIVFESELPPQELKNFIRKFPKKTFGINYDSGNSSSLGFDPAEEFDAYGERILNIHIKDRILGGTTVPLGTGNTDFKIVFKKISEIDYKGNLILQTARADDENHIGALKKYKKFVHNIMDRL
ncbi:sugar phosphate isomerase/epimerase [Bacteriovoracales bacterium]|nr:sugar phosphate isomerase/epimerase [Bacteriovoracales bacterium]